jgi:PAS domain S-box-containing protein
MPSAGRPANEAQRIAALRTYEILDSANEAAFDDLAAIAAHVLDVPTALVSLVDTDREWFLARYGLDASEISRDASFCAHVVEQERPIVVPDALVDPLFSDNPSVHSYPNVRFYAGMPLRTADGFVLGSLCAIDTESRMPTDAQIHALSLLAKQVVLLLEKRRARLLIDRERVEALTMASRLEATFDVMAEGVVVQDSTGAITSWNAAAPAILGLSGEQLQGRTSVDPRWRSVRANGAPYPGNEHPAMEVLRTGERQHNAVMGVHKPDGSLTWISINSRPSAWTEDRVAEVVTTFHDITPLKLAAERLAQQERLAATGTLVAGVGHEINNPLAFMIGNLDMALEELREISGPSPSARQNDLLEMLGDARMGADRIRKIVRGLRALSREDLALQPVDLHQVIDNSIGMSLHELRHRATVRVDMNGDHSALADEARLTQVLVNLLVNAAQAFPAADPDANLVTVRVSASTPDKIRISVIDNGPGVSPELQSRIFDPFFTTKAVGHGTGLGLAVSRGILAGLGGELTLDPGTERGASFHLDLVRADALDSVPTAHKPHGQAPRGRILVIDDDAAVLSTLKRALSRDHDVVALRDPRLVEQELTRDPAFHAILCDLMMPHLSGMDVYDMIRTRFPRMAERVIFMTGGSTAEASDRFLAEIPNEVIEKPFTLTGILALARRKVLRFSA